MDIINNKFYPIIVVTDRTLDEHGVNYLFTSTFDDLVKEFQLEDLNIQKPIVVQLDSLIKFADLVKYKKIKLNSIFDSYISWLNNEDKFIRTSSFSNFIKIQASKYDKELSKLVDKKLEVIFE